MREILFKAKRIDNGEWVIGHYIPFGLDVDIHYDIVFSKGDYIFCSESQQLIEIDIKTLCQYTGLSDKHERRVSMDKEREYLNSLANKPKRDKERIKPLLQELEKYWLADHDQRFGQLVYNLARFNNLDMFNAEDDEWFNAITESKNKELKK